MITKDRFVYKGVYNKTFSIACADNGYGKTELIMKVLCHNVPREKIYVLNTSRQRDWTKFIPKKNIYVPVMFNIDFIEQFLLEFMKTHSDCMLILDDFDAYPVKKSDIVYKIVREARHSNVGIVAATGMLQRLPTIYYQQADYLFFGPQESKWNVQYISKANIPQEDANILMKLPKYVFAAWIRNEHRMYLVKVNLNSF
jgi:hypothetical protein